MGAAMLQLDCLRNAIRGQITHSDGFIETRKDARKNQGCLKSCNITEEIAEDQDNAPAHFLQEGRAGAVSGPPLAARPSPIFSLHGATEDSEE
jgi:hypothetical protein